MSVLASNLHQRYELFYIDISYLKSSSGRNLYIQMWPYSWSSFANSADSISWCSDGKYLKAFAKACCIEKKWHFNKVYRFIFLEIDIFAHLFTFQRKSGVSFWSMSYVTISSFRGRQRIKLQPGQQSFDIRYFLSKYKCFWVGRACCYYVALNTI